MEEEPKLRIAAIADLHMRESEKGKWVDLFKEVSKKSDVLLIGGDLTDTGDEDQAKALAEELKELYRSGACCFGQPRL